MNIVEELQEYFKQQMHNEMLSSNGKYVATSVILQCIKIVKENIGWRSPDNPPEDHNDVLILYKEKEPLDENDLIIGQDISCYTEVCFGGKSLGYKDWMSPFEYFHKNYEVIGWQPLPDNNVWMEK